MGYCVTALGTVCLIGVLWTDESEYSLTDQPKLKGVLLLWLAVAAFVVPLKLVALSTTTLLAIGCGVCALLVLIFYGAHEHYHRKALEDSYGSNCRAPKVQRNGALCCFLLWLVLLALALVKLARLAEEGSGSA